MSSISSGQSTNDSTSTPSIMETPENSIIDAISGVASGLAGQMLNWANGVFAKTSQITDQAVGNFFNVSQQMQGLSNNLTSQYNDVFAPQNRSLAREADSYNSTARQAVDMGQAGATQAQAGDAGMKNSEEALRSFGIDPSSGRYAALDKAAAVQNAANVAGAENTQRNVDAQTGQRLRSEAVQVGATLPAAIANVNNTAIQANTGASNASLANANTGKNLFGLPNDYLKTAMEVKLPPTGNQSQSKGQSTNSSLSASPATSGAKSDPSHSSGGGSGAGAGAGGAGGGHGGAAWMPQHGGGNSYDNPSFSDFSYNQPAVGTGDFQWAGNQDIYQPGGTMGVGQPGQSDQPIDYIGGQDQNPFQDPGFGQNYGDNTGGTYTGSQGAQDTEWGNINYDPNQNAVDPGWGQTYDQPAQTDWGNGADQYTGGGASNNDYGTSDPNSDFYAGDYSGGSSEDMGGAYARGGPIGSAIPQKGSSRNAWKGPRPSFMADGGQVDPSMSPSGGQQVDDVQAQGPGNSNIRLNANEFVIPDDVAKWKGQEFFQKLIMDSRKRFQQAPAHGQPTPQR